MKKQPVLCGAPNVFPGLSACRLHLGHAGNHVVASGAIGWSDAEIFQRLVAAEQELRELHRQMAGCGALSPTSYARCDRTAGHTGDHSVRGGQEAWALVPPPLQAPVPLILHCPMCNVRHIDQGRFATKLHHTHACQGCGHVWRPAIVDTVGVQFLPGFKDPE